MLSDENFPDKGLICFTGSGGKTTLMLRLAHCLKRRIPVLVTSTTHMAVEEADPSHVLLGSTDSAEIKNRITEQGYVFLFQERNENKYVGFSPDIIMSFRRRELAPCILVEADGAQRLSLKGYAEYEPPLPVYMDCQIIVVGLDALLYPMNEDTVARFDIVKQFLGIEKNTMLTAPLLLKLLTSSDMYLKNSPPGTKRILCLNKTDMVRPDTLKKWTTYLCPRLRGYSEVYSTVGQSWSVDKKNLPASSR
jgi:probable selenium-dependent hydroxylase accessory protein YqeC